MWTEYASPDYNPETLRYFVRGRYQANLLAGVESCSGSTLRGRAAKYRGRYQASRDSLLSRLRAAGVPVTLAKRERGKRVLVIGAVR